MTRSSASVQSAPSGDSVPVGWAAAAIGSFTSKVGSGATPRGGSESYKTAGTPLIRSQNVHFDGFSDEGLAFIDEHQAAALDDATVRADDVLLNITGASIGRVTTVPTRMAGARVNQHVCIIRPAENVLARYLSYYLSSPVVQSMIMSEEYGVTRQALTKGQILAFDVPIAPLAEQKRIVAKVEDVLARVNAARERLAKLPIILNRFRQSVLAAACSGCLTADWRDANPSTETGQQLVERVRKLAATGAASPIIIENLGGRGRDMALVEARSVDADGLPEIPATWTWVYLPQVGYMNRGKSRNRPRNAPHLYGGKYPFIQTGDIAQSRGRITRHRQTYSEAGLAQSRLWPNGTMCVTIAANIADTAILTYPACFPDSVVGIITEPELAAIEYVEFFMRTARSNLSDFAPATAQKNINIGILNDVAVPLPPRREQAEIVRRVTAMFSLADKIEARLAAGLMRSEKLIQSTLAKAFRGELVPTEAELAEREGRDFESADQLLARIRAAKNTPVSKAARSRRTELGKPAAQVESKLGRGIYLSRGAIAAYAINKLHLRLQFGRVQLEKVLYLAEAHVGIDLQGQPKREQFGPLDPYIYKLENLAKKMRWFFAKGGKGQGTHYVPGNGISDRLTWADRMLGQRKAEFDRLLGWLAQMKTEQAEVFATVYAAWNDFLLDGTKPSDTQIITEVRENWHEAKKRFPPSQLQTCINWMHEQNFVPAGRGPHTSRH